MSSGQVVVNLRAQNVAFLREQVRAATDRLNVGEGTKTDVAQANASPQLGHLRLCRGGRPA